MNLVRVRHVLALQAEIWLVGDPNEVVQLNENEQSILGDWQEVCPVLYARGVVTCDCVG